MATCTQNGLAIHQICIVQTIVVGKNVGFHGHPRCGMTRVACHFCGNRHHRFGPGQYGIRFFISYLYP